MEQERDDETKDYWLIQFQRLLDNKPQVLIDAVGDFIDNVLLDLP